MGRFTFQLSQHPFFTDTEVQPRFFAYFNDFIGRLSGSLAMGALAIFAFMHLNIPFLGNFSGLLLAVIALTNGLGAADSLKRALIALFRHRQNEDRLALVSSSIGIVAILIFYVVLGTGLRQVLEAIPQ